MWLHPSLKMMYDAPVMSLFMVTRISTGRSLRLLTALTLAVGLGACGSSGSKGGGTVAQRGTYKVGNPYKIDGVTYTPREEFTRVETGVASWYGPGFHGKSTANGERYDQADRTAAHRTLQMPAVVRVTNLENGTSTVVRINDRGPFARNRVIDLSRTAAEELNMVGSGTARVKVEQLQAESQAVKDVAVGGGGPAEQHQAMAQVGAGKRAPAATPAPPPAPAPVQSPLPTPAIAVAQAPAPVPPSPQPQLVWASNPRNPSSSVGESAPVATSVASLAPATSASGFYVQVGAFSSPENAERQRGAVRSYGSPEISQVSAGGREVYRVRLGPYTTADAAGIVADRLKRSGYGDARVVAD